MDELKLALDNSKSITYVQWLNVERFLEYVARKPYILQLNKGT